MVSKIPLNSFSLVVPVYKQEKTIKSNLRSLVSVLNALPYTWEILAVVDGRLDNSEKEIRKLKNRRIKTIAYDRNQGKGYAVKKGILEAHGDVIGFIDGGMDLDPSAIPLMINYMTLENADIVIGSKLHPDSVVSYPLLRRILSWGYRTIIKVLFNLSIKDTQVGLKIFRKEVAHDIFKKVTVKNYVFDIEVLALANILDYKVIQEAPIKLNFHPDSITSANFWKIVISMFWDTLNVFYRLKILRKIK